VFPSYLTLLALGFLVIRKYSQFDYEQLNEKA
jgi:hypothetical protein